MDEHIDWSFEINNVTDESAKLCIYKYTAHAQRYNDVNSFFQFIFSLKRKRLLTNGKYEGVAADTVLRCFVTPTVTVFLFFAIFAKSHRHISYFNAKKIRLQNRILDKENTLSYTKSWSHYRKLIHSFSRKYFFRLRHSVLLREALILKTQWSISNYFSIFSKVSIKWRRTSQTKRKGKEVEKLVCFKFIIKKRVTDSTFDFSNGA